ncbi:hypothetical protein [Hyalangium versicolor]|uniref:hypothetical protein n=1 Tax=Hyalangium versicolor TaxID=2861190 RepID=UPI001CCD2A78|nr:hypothetical protein [Hyalangium versicolor]
MKRGVGIALWMVTLGGAAFAGTPEAPSSLDSLKGQFGFNWFNSPSKEKCVEIKDKLLKEFQKNYTCDLKEIANTSSGKPGVACTRKDEKKQYLIFKTKAFCEEERETQMANSEG